MKEFLTETVKWVVFIGSLAAVTYAAFNLDLC